MTRDWQEWHEQYDDPASSLSRRLEDVRRQLAADLDRRADEGQRSARLLSLCAGDGRDTIPVLAARTGLDVDACLVELDPELADTARAVAARSGVEIDVRTADAGSTAAFRDRLPVDVLMLCGIFGNVSDADVERCVDSSRAMVWAGGTVIWTRGSRVPDDPTDRYGDPAEWVRRLFTEAGFEEVGFVAPQDATYRVGVERQPTFVDAEPPDRLFSFVR
jgi:hypothetical protein